MGWDLRSLRTGEDVVQAYGRDKLAGVELIIMDFESVSPKKADVLNAVTTTKVLKLLKCSIPIIILTSSPDDVHVPGAWGVLSKPVPPTHTDTDTDTLTHTHTQRERHNTHTDTHTHTHRQTDRQTHIERERERQTDRHI